MSCINLGNTPKLPLNIVLRVMRSIFSSSYSSSNRYQLIKVALLTVGMPPAVYIIFAFEICSVDFSCSLGILNYLYLKHQFFLQCMLVGLLVGRFPLRRNLLLGSWTLIFLHIDWVPLSTPKNEILGSSIFLVIRLSRYYRQKYSTWWIINLFLSNSW